MAGKIFRVFRDDERKRLFGICRSALYKIQITNSIMRRERISLQLQRFLKTGERCLIMFFIECAIAFQEQHPKAQIIRQLRFLCQRAFVRWFQFLIFCHIHLEVFHAHAFQRIRIDLASDNGTELLHSIICPRILIAYRFCLDNLAGNRSNVIFGNSEVFHFRIRTHIDSCLLCRIFLCKFKRLSFQFLYRNRRIPQDHPFACYGLDCSVHRLGKRDQPSEKQNNELIVHSAHLLQRFSAHISP